MTKLKIGDTVQIAEGSGLDSGIIGTVITYSEYLRLGGDSDDFLTHRHGSGNRKLTYIHGKNKYGVPINPEYQAIVMFTNRCIKL
jgi:hypothetical protein